LARLANKVIIMTGAAAGIGRASCLLFAAEGAHVIAVDLQEEALKTLHEEVGRSSRRSGVGAVVGSTIGSVIGIVADASKSEDVQNVVALALERFGRIDILFNNAGIVLPGKIHEIEERDWDRTMAVNVRSMFLFCNRVVPIFRQQGGGVILNTASATALRSVIDRAAYTASKGAVVALTKSMALDYVKENIRVNCLCPGTVNTPSLQDRLKATGDLVIARKQFDTARRELVSS